MAIQQVSNGSLAAAAAPSVTVTLPSHSPGNLIVVDRDLLTCEVDQVSGTQVLQTYLAVLDNMNKGRSIFNVHTSLELTTFDQGLAQVSDTLKAFGEVIRHCRDGWPTSAWSPAITSSLWPRQAIGMEMTTIAPTFANGATV